MAVTVEREQGVLETFRRHDSDGVGMIGREQLALVLQTIAPAAWTKDEIDELIGAADINGNGYIQLDEFIQWVFQGHETQKCFLNAEGRRLRVSVTDLEHVAPSAVAPPPASLEDVSLMRYVLSENADGWYVQIVSLDSSQRLAVLSNGVIVNVTARELPSLKELLDSIPDGAVVSGLLQEESDQQEIVSVPNHGIIVTDFECVTPAAVARPPKSIGDPALRRYLLEQDGEGWYVELQSLESDTYQVILSNGARVGIIEDQVKELISLFSTAPNGAVVSGLLRVATNVPQ